MLSLHAYSQTPCCLCLLHTHTRSEMPHCPSCNRHFARRDNLRRHLKGGYCRPTVWIPPASSSSSHPSGAGPAPEEYADEFHVEADGGPPMEDVLPEDDPFLPFWSELHAVRSSRSSRVIWAGHKMTRSPSTPQRVYKVHKQTGRHWMPSLVAEPSGFTELERSCRRDTSR